MKILMSDNPLAWCFAEYAPGKRLTKDMVDFDVSDRFDVQVNCHGVVLFFDSETARRLLKIKEPS